MEGWFCVGAAEARSEFDLGVVDVSSQLRGWIASKVVVGIVVSEIEILVRSRGQLSKVENFRH